MHEHYLGLGHVAIYTRDMEESIAFYEKLGGTVKDRDGVPTPEGEKKLALVSFGGITLELVQDPGAMPMEAGNIPHFALLVDDLDAAAAAVRAAGVDTFLTPEKKVLPGLFGGLQNWFFTGPSGEQIELLQML
ncbi:MAG: VOC family protein [Oscillibacter sp.]|jgi:catechol 2,3-dioxygenase-like lactoylglutathione lyase family enzyme|uniref:VOC family protein n=1 Tax=uncultured Oscillibacter sp. TaxID=876091 RepID=UPI00216EBDEB|nr:VOC family protein [uncultured Oscillibacter sp.]MCI9644640.1 VOC family protein [Oscillibacter sp.]